jgi:alkylation response protein AidB-like acyl-CoA dehydrogenase
MASWMIDHFGGEAQRRRFLPKLTTMEHFASYCLTEPGAGSDAASLKSRAERRGDHYVVNGAKAFISGGGASDVYVCMLRTGGEGPRGISCIVVEKGTPGLSFGKKEKKLGWNSQPTAMVVFENCRVPVANRIGEEGGGFVAMMERLPQERIGAAVSNLANARAILEETIAYTKQRQAFGQPVGSFQANKFLLAELVTKVDVTQAYVDAAVLAHCRRELTATEAAKAKWWSAQVQNEVLDACVQLYGGYGYMNEYRVARAWRDARVTKIWAGSNEIMKELIGRELGL